MKKLWQQWRQWLEWMVITAFFYPFLGPLLFPAMRQSFCSSPHTGFVGMTQTDALEKRQYSNNEQIFYFCAGYYFQFHEFLTCFFVGVLRAENTRCFRYEIEKTVLNGLQGLGEFG